MPEFVYLLYRIVQSTYSYDGTDDILECIFKDMPDAEALVKVGVPINDAGKLADWKSTNNWFMEKIEVIQ